VISSTWHPFRPAAASHQPSGVASGVTIALRIRPEPGRRLRFREGPLPYSPRPGGRMGGLATGPNLVGTRGQS